MGRLPSGPPQWVYGEEYPPTEDAEMLGNELASFRDFIGP